MGILKRLFDFNPIGAAKDAYVAHQRNKAVEKQVEAKIAEKELDRAAQVEFSNAEWEILSKWREETTWKDEYITVSVLAVFNLIVLGGILEAFGIPQVLQGVRAALVTFNEVTQNSDGTLTLLGEVTYITILAGIGVYGFKKVLRG